MAPLSTASGLGTSTAEIAATGVTVFEPDVEILLGLVNSARAAGSHIYLFANSPLERAVLNFTEAADDCTVLGNSTNVGQGAALNAIMARAARDGHANVLMFDQDTAPDASLWGVLGHRLKRLMSREAQIAAVAPRLVPPSRSSYLPMRYQFEDAKNVAEPDKAAAFVPTSGSLITVAAWHAVGPFRADYFIDGIDVDWGYRARDAGWVSVLAMDIELTHRWGNEQNGERVGAKSSIADAITARSQAARLSPDRLYYYIRNKLDVDRQHTRGTHSRARTKLRLWLQIIGVWAARYGEPAYAEAIKQARRDARDRRFGRRS
ncbi:MAG: hypothetical protein AAFY64_00835 [Pseudomonadota bacterium]